MTPSESIEAAMEADTANKFDWNYHPLQEFAWRFYETHRIHRSNALLRALAGSQSNSLGNVPALSEEGDSDLPCYL